MDSAGSIRFVNSIDLDHVFAGAGRRAKRERPFDDSSRRLDALDFVELLQSTLHLSGLRGLGSKALDEAHLLGEHRLLSFVFGLAATGFLGARALIEVVIARVGADLATVDFDDLLDHAVHHVAVVTGHQYGAGIAAEEALEPED